MCNHIGYMPRPIAGAMIITWTVRPPDAYTASQASAERKLNWLTQVPPQTAPTMRWVIFGALECDWTHAQKAYAGRRSAEKQEGRMTTSTSDMLASVILRPQKQSATTYRHDAGSPGQPWTAGSGNWAAKSGSTPSPASAACHCRNW